MSDLIYEKIESGETISEDYYRPILKRKENEK